MNKQQQQQQIIPHIRTVKIKNLPQIKISLFNEKSKIEINRIFMPIESTLLPQKIYKNIQNKNDNIPTIDNFDKIKQSLDNQKQEKNPLISSTIDISSTSRETIFNRQIIQQPNIASSPKIQQIMNTIDHQEPVYNHEQDLSPSSVLIQEQQGSTLPINFIDEHQKIPIENLIISTNTTDIRSPVIRVEQSLSPSLSQLIPDSIINDKQTINRIFNEKNSTHFTHPSKLVTLTPINSSLKKTSKLINDDLSSSNHVHYYQIGSIFTSTSTFIMHKNEVIAHATASDPFLSDTIFIILIATLTIIILLFCLGLFCLCRHTTKRNISPSFDGGSYAELNGHSFEIPIDNYQQKISKYENNIPYITDISSPSIQIRSSITHPSLTNDRILLPQTVTLHHTGKQQIKMNKKNLKKKRIGFCCCHSKQTPLTTTVNARTRMNRNEM